MKFIPILFSTPMVKAILEGRKTVTRRVIKEADGWDVNWKVLPIKEQHKDGIQRYEIRCGTQYCVPFFKAKCNVGDILWVRETIEVYVCNDGGEDYTNIKRTADESYVTFQTSLRPGKHPSIHMPKPACRLFLEVVSVRPERLQDITEEDAIKEGIHMNNKPHPGWYWMENVYSTDSPVLAFQKLWQSINGEESWNANPWVWRIEFKKIERPESFLPA